MPTSNRDIIVTVITASFLFGNIFCLPRKSANESCERNETDSAFEVYDQRQNGTENVRVNVKDVVLVWAPSDALLGATSFLDSDLLDYPNEEVPQKPNGSNEVENPTSILDILSSFASISDVSPYPPENKPQNTSTVANNTVSINNENSDNSNISQNQVNYTEPSETTGDNNIKRSKLKLSGLLLPFIRRKQH